MVTVTNGSFSISKPMTSRKNVYAALWFSMAASSLISNISLSFNFSYTLIVFKPQNLKPQFSIASALSHCHPPLSSVSFQDTKKPLQLETLQKPEPKASSSNLSARLFVGNLPYTLPSSLLAQRFGEAGNVVSVEIVYDDIMDRSRGFAFVTMGSVEEAGCAIRMFDGSMLKMEAEQNSSDGNGCDDGQEIGGRIIKVNIAEIPKRGKRQVMGSSYKGFVDSPHKIYAGNLGWGLTSQCLRDAFAEQPGFLSAKVIYERNSGKSQGYGFVTFKTAEDVEAALNSMNGVEVHGRPLRLNIAADKETFSHPIIHQNARSNFDSMELVFKISKQVFDENLGRLLLNENRLSQAPMKESMANGLHVLGVLCGVVFGVGVLTIMGVVQGGFDGVWLVYGRSNYGGDAQLRRRKKAKKK
ncbi:unnamed protein product [Sphenostylis stenocarpa]|uniref:RRM domain-containing protein n=1 Tax=Sphenostylis stenocarpa TaxID=92480 RepID=A0AA86SMY7_9FABA|nr:unnamed protein product [Sphenostylis stenocarpa]